MALRRASALIIATLALAGLIWQFEINAGKPGLSGVGIRLWLMLRHYTNFASLMVAAVMAPVALGRPVNRNFTATATLSIMMVGLIYQIFLRLPEPMPAPHWYPDFVLHRVVPVLAPLWWLVYGDKGLRLADLPIWLVPPVLFCPYALIRAAVTGIYPYYFLNIETLGLVPVLLNCLGLLLAFAVLGAALWLVARLIR